MNYTNYAPFQNLFLQFVNNDTVPQAINFQQKIINVTKIGGAHYLCVDKIR